MSESISSEERDQVQAEAAAAEEFKAVALADLPQSLQQACARAGWTSLMPVQSRTLPCLMAGRDCMIQSRTGSGKTGAYLLPMLALLDPEQKKTQALVLAPTRELACQVEREARVLFEDAGISVCSLYGGVGYGRQLDALRAGAQFIVGTPGRILDHLMRRTLLLDDLRTLVFDEADRMLSIGFYPDMKEIQRYLPRKRILSALFSATYPQHVLNLAGEFLRDPHMISLSQGQVHVASTEHLFVECGRMDKDRTLVRLLETENPASAIIFCNTKATVHYIAAVLQGFGYDADELSADLSQSKRESVLERLREGKVRLLVSTDVAARGIDIPELSHVFLYEPPEDRESYIHRSGRTGRAGAAGTVISLVDIMEKMELKRIAAFYRIELEQKPNPTDADAASAAWQRESALLGTRLRACTGLQLERAKRYLPAVKSMAESEDEDQLMLLALLLDADYQRSLGLEQTLPRPRVHGKDESAKRTDRHSSEKQDGEVRKRSRRRRGGEGEGPAERQEAGIASPAGQDDLRPDDSIHSAGEQQPSEETAVKKRRRRPHRRRSIQGKADGKNEESTSDGSGQS